MSKGLGVSCRSEESRLQRPHSLRLPAGVDGSRNEAQTRVHNCHLLGADVRRPGCSIVRGRAASRTRRHVAFVEDGRRQDIRKNNLQIRRINRDEVHQVSGPQDRLWKVGYQRKPTLRDLDKGQVWGGGMLYGYKAIRRFVSDLNKHHTQPLRSAALPDHARHLCRSARPRLS